MNNLFVDTSNWNLIIILEVDGVVKDKLIVKDTKKVSDIMVDDIKSLLSKNKLVIKDIDNIYVTLGPGSYTGVRVALTMARTLKTLDNTFNVFVINSLLYQAGLNKTISILDAHGQKLFIAVYENGLSVVEPTLIEASDLDKYKEMYPDFKIVQDYKDVDFTKNYMDLKPMFKQVDEVEDLKPLYLKEALK